MVDLREALRGVAPCYDMDEFKREGGQSIRGSTAEVTEYIHIKSNKRMALKEFSFNAKDPECSKHLQKFISEVSHLLKPKQVAVKCYGVVLHHRSETDLGVAIAMRPCISLASKLYGDPAPSVETRKSWVIQTARCLAHLHDDHSLCHLDVKPSNFLIDPEIEDESANVKIADFGLTIVRDTIPTGKSMTLDFPGLTFDYAPPEFSDEEGKPGKRSDVFSWAIMANEILSCAKPWPDIKKKQFLPAKISKGARPKLVECDDVPKIFKDLIQQCWRNDPTERPNMSDVYKQLQLAIGDSHGSRMARDVTHDKKKKKLAAMRAIHPLPAAIKNKIRLIKHKYKHMAELSLPWAEQTHELLFEETTKLVFVSQLTESTLLVIKTDAEGNLTDEVRAWGIGNPPMSKNEKQLFGGHQEFHNISLADIPGFLWLSLQIPNMILLVRAADFLSDGPIEACQVIELPDLLVAQQGFQFTLPRNMGSPHVARQNPRTGRIFVGLKGRAATRPGREVRLRDCDCCDRDAHLDNYRKVFGDEAADYFRKLPSEDAFAIWAGDPRNLTMQHTIECPESPPMLAFHKCDTGDSVFVALDQTPQLMHIEWSVKGCKTSFLDVSFPPRLLPPLPTGTKRDFTGPGIVSTKDDQFLWCALLGHNAALLRIDPNQKTMICYHFPELKGNSNSTHPDLRFIHLAVDDVKHRLYCLSSSLLEDIVCDAIVVLEFEEDSDWKHVTGVYVDPLPEQSQSCKAHRIQLREDNIFVTEFSNSMLLQKSALCYTLDVVDEHPTCDGSKDSWSRSRVECFRKELRILTNESIKEAVAEYCQGGEAKVNIVDKYGDISHWDTSAVTMMEDLFAIEKTFNEDLSAWNVSAVTDMAGMFREAKAFNGDLNAWNVSAVTTMKDMFLRATSFNRDLNAWNVATVNNMGCMFKENLWFNSDLSKWNVGSVTDMSYMFHRAKSFNGDLSAWNVANVTDMNEMFASARKFNGDLRAWNVSRVTTMERMFFWARSFNGDLSAWNVAKVTDMKSMFSFATSFNGDLSAWNVAKVTDMESMFSFAKSFNGDLNAWNVSSVTDMNQMFSMADAFNGDLSAWNVGRVTNMKAMFSYATAFNGDLNAWNVSCVTNMSNMFCSATLFNGDLSAWNASSRTSAADMFSEAPIASSRKRMRLQ